MTAVLITYIMGLFISRTHTLIAKYLQQIQILGMHASRLLYKMRAVIKTMCFLLQVLHQNGLLRVKQESLKFIRFSGELNIGSS